MQETERAELTEKSNTLRLELKVWEKSFAAANNGKKASRDDIKNHPDIATKYKEYNNLRDILSGKIQLPKPKAKHQTPRKRKHEESQLEASKRQQIAHTPSRSLHPWDLDPYHSPSVVRNLFTPSKKTALGPTPQKDGQVLGLFDLLQDSGTEPSPSKLENTKALGINLPQATPQKSRPQDSLKHSKTPVSASKRYLLDAFATPMKNKSLNGQGGRTPSSVSKLHFSTPSFLRRDSQRIRQLPAVNENDDGPMLSPEMIRVPRKPLVRGLSSMLAGLRRMEEEAADEDLEALYEMENEMAGITSKPAPNPKLKPVLEEAAVLVEDSQPGFPLGGFDDEAKFDSEPEEVKNPTLGRDGRPLKAYKKKGQKRTTRRVNMKPVRSKSSALNPIPADEDSDDELVAGHVEAIPETQGDDMSGFADARNFDSDTQSEYTASEGGTRYKRPDQSKKRKVMGRDGKIKIAARKVTALANQNFKRLKLRNSGAKGGAAHNSRFRRRK